MNAIEELRLLLRPPAGGLYLVSTGAAAQRAVQRRIYGVDDDAAVQTRFEAGLARIGEAKAVILSVPSDVGAGFVRGANLGGQAIREALLDAVPDWPSRLERAGIVDVGDVFVVPQLLSDDMLSVEQIRDTRRAIYPAVDPSDRQTLPVSPLSIAERALARIFECNPRVVPFILGGDHSVAWPVVAALSRARSDPWGIVQFDAHTDLLDQRLGVRICFGTWSFHANELLGRRGRLVQVGIRATRFPQSHWEGLLGVRQFWATECARSPSGTIAAIVDHLHAAGVTSLYVTNDIDGTDDSFADATGTPEPGGLTPDFVVALIRALRAAFPFCAADLVEVAPMLERSAGGRERTLATSVRYVRETLSCIAGQEL